MKGIKIKNREVADYYASEEAFIQNCHKCSRGEKVMRLLSWARKNAEGRARLTDCSQRNVRVYARLTLEEIDFLRKENEELRKLVRA